MVLRSLDYDAEVVKLHPHFDFLLLPHLLVPLLGLFLQDIPRQTLGTKGRKRREREDSAIVSCGKRRLSWTYSS